MNEISFFNQLIDKLDPVELDHFLQIQAKIMKWSDNIFATTAKNINKSPVICMVPGCTKNTQNYCHLLQRNGILSNISHENHLIQLSIRDVYKWNSPNQEALTPLEFKKIGVGNAFTGRLFCDTHDTELFKNLETNTLDFDNYETQLLFTYRSICYELRESENNIQACEKRIKEYNALINYVQSEPISSRVIFLATHGLKTSIHSETLTIVNTTNKIAADEKLKLLFENEITSLTCTFEFIHVETNLMEIAASSIFSTELYKTKQDKNYPIFIQIIPYNNKSHIIIGYHKDYCDYWIKSYLLKWSSFSSLEIEQECSRLLLTQFTAWCMSPKLYERFNSIDQEQLLKYHLQYFSNEMKRITIEDWDKIKFNMFSATYK